MERHDAEIVQEVLSGNSNAYEELVLRYQKPIFNMAYRLVGHTEDARDISQEAFVKAYQSLASYNPKYSFGSWLFRITHNLSIDHLRYKTRRPQVSMSGTASDVMDPESDSSYQKEWADQSPDVRTVLIEKQKSEWVHQVIQTLPANYRAVIVLRHIEEKSVEEIAEILEIPEGTVKTNLFRARQLMREKMSKVS